jgi:hypothetical protein
MITRLRRPSPGGVLLFPCGRTSRLPGPDRSRSPGLSQLRTHHPFSGAPPGPARRDRDLSGRAVHRDRGRGSHRAGRKRTDPLRHRRQPGPSPAIGETCLVETAFAEEGASPLYFPNKSFSPPIRSGNPPWKPRSRRNCRRCAASPPGRPAPFTARRRPGSGAPAPRDDRSWRWKLSALYAVAAYRGAAAAGVVVVATN